MFIRRQVEMEIQIFQIFWVLHSISVILVAYGGMALNFHFVSPAAGYFSLVKMNFVSHFQFNMLKNRYTVPTTVHTSGIAPPEKRASAPSLTLNPPLGALLYLQSPIPWFESVSPRILRLDRWTQTSARRQMRRAKEPDGMLFNRIQTLVELIYGDQLLENSVPSDYRHKLKFDSKMTDFADDYPF